MMFYRSKNDSFVVWMICRFFSLYRAVVQFCFSCKIVYIECCWSRFYSFLLFFFILNETILSSAKFAAQTIWLFCKKWKRKRSGSWNVKVTSYFLPRELLVNLLLENKKNSNKLLHSLTSYQCVFCY